MDLFFESSNIKEVYDILKQEYNNLKIETQLEINQIKD